MTSQFMESKLARKKGAGGKRDIEGGGLDDSRNEEVRGSGAPSAQLKGQETTVSVSVEL